MIELKIIITLIAFFLFVSWIGLSCYCLYKTYKKNHKVWFVFLFFNSFIGIITLIGLDFFPIVLVAPLPIIYYYKKLKKKEVK